MECNKTLSFFVLLVSAILFFIYKNYYYIKSKDSSNVNLVIISLGSGDIVNAVTLIKSMAMFTSRVVDIYLLVDDNASAARYNKKFKKWPEHVRSKLNIKYLTPLFPIDNEVYWNMHFEKYRTLKFYLPELFYSLDAVIYLDSDTILFNDIAPLWDKFAEFNATQMIGAASEIGWESYGEHLEYPYYGEYGFNSGVMLMNLTRLRKFELRKMLEPAYVKYSENIRWTDQCLFNIIFSNKPDAIYDLNCAWNFMVPNCRNASLCQPENDDGVKILHGASKFFEKNLPTTFKMIHKIFIEFDLHANRSIHDDVKSLLDGGTLSECTGNHKRFLKGLKH